MDSKSEKESMPYDTGLKTIESSEPISRLLLSLKGKGKGGGQVDLILCAVSMKKRARSLAR